MSRGKQYFVNFLNDYNDLEHLYNKFLYYKNL